MTPNDLKTILHAMNDHEFRLFKESYGGEWDRDAYVVHFGNNFEEMEPVLCQILSMPTEAERQRALADSTARATIEQAAAAHRSNELALESNTIAKRANTIAWWACVFSIGALIAAVAAVLVAAYKP